MKGKLPVSVSGTLVGLVSICLSILVGAPSAAGQSQEGSRSVQRPHHAARTKTYESRLRALQERSPAPVERGLRRVARPPLRFEPNQGQFDSRARFFARGAGYALFLTDRDAVLALYEAPEAAHPAASTRGVVPPAYSVSALRMELVGARHSPAIEGRGLLPSRSHYYIGSDPAGWRSNVPNYARVNYSQVYPGVDLVYYANQDGRLQYDFVVAPGADPAAIKLAFEGVDRIESEGGDLLLHAGDRQVRFLKPFIYQEVDGRQVEVAGGYLLAPEAHRKGRFEVAFELASYDLTRPLVIDPVLVYSSYFGSTGWDEARSIAVDRFNGDFFVTAITTAADFPLRNPLFMTHSGDFDAVIAKFSATGELLFSSYFGGAGIDMLEDVVVRYSDGDIFAAGWTTSTNFPTQNALQPNYSGSSGTDAVVLRLAWDGSFLDFSTYLGGTGGDTIEAIALDASETPHFRGRTNSSNFPTTPGVFQPNLVGSHNMFVTKMAPDGTSLLFSTYLGGGDEGLGQRGKSIAVDWLGDVYVTGNTQSANYPVVNAFQSVLPGVRSAVVSKIKSDGTQLLYSTYLGGTGLDVGASIAVDLSRHIYILGNTSSADFPTMNPLQAARASTGNNTDLFVTKLGFSGGLEFSTYLGGTTHQEAGFMILGPDGDLYLTGWTQSADFPLVRSLQGFGGQGDAVVVRLGFDPVVGGDGGFNTVVRFSTFLGGAGFEIGRGIDIGHFGQLYVAGDTSSANFPTTATPFQSTFLGGNWDAFTSIISLPNEHCVSPAHRQSELGCAFTTIQSAVDAAGPGDVIMVYPGLSSDPERHVYQEAVFIGKSLHLLGADGEHEKPLVAPAIGTNAIYAFTVSSNSGTLGSITIRNFEVDWDGGISVRAANDVEIASNDIYAQIGVSLDPNGIGSDFRIFGNRVRDNQRKSLPLQYGISVFSQPHDVFVFSNDVSGCDPGFSIALQFDGFFLRTIVAGNIVTQCYVGIYFEHREDPSFPAGETLIFGNQIQALEQGIEVFTQIGPDEEGYVSNLFIGDNVVGGGPSQALNQTPDHVQRGFELGFTNGSSTAIVQTGFNRYGETRTAHVAVEGMGLGLEGVPAGFQSGAIPAGLIATDQFVHITGADGVRLNQVMFLVDTAAIAAIDPATLRIFHCSNLDGDCFGWTELPSTAFSLGNDQYVVSTDAPVMGILTVFGSEQAPNPVPAISELLPSSTTEAGNDLQLTVLGQDFVAGSEVRWNGSPRATTLVNSTRLDAVIPAPDIAEPGTALITVFNPAPGGGESNALEFRILAVGECGSMPQGATSSWTGVVSSAWSDSSNWVNGPPQADDIVFICDSSPNNPSLDASADITSLLMEPGATLHSGGDLLRVAADMVAGSVSGSGNFEVGGNFTSPVGTTIQANRLQVAGALIVEGEYSVSNTHFVGTSQQIPALPYLTVRVTGTASAAADLSMAHLEVTGTGARVDLGARTFQISGGLTINNGGLFTMEDPNGVVITGNVFIAGTPAMIMKAGLMRVRGDFTLPLFTGEQRFVAEGTHTVRLEGAGLQQVHLSSGNRFYNLEVANNSAEGIRLLTHISVAGMFSSPPAAMPRLWADGSGWSVSVAGLDVEGLVLDNVRLLLQSLNPVITQFDNVIFQNQNPGVNQLHINHPGAAAPFTFNNLTFSTQPTTGFYIVANDNAADENVLTIDLVNPTAVNGPAFTSTSGGAVVNWPGSQQPANPVLIGPTGYRCQHDSPFYAYIRRNEVTLATFEGGAGLPAGVSASAGSPLGPGSITDSVDCDDGARDGSGTGGWSFFSGSGAAGITFTFDAAQLGGSLPNAAGIVWTDGSGTTSFEAFDSSGASLGVIGPVTIEDGNHSGGVTEDHFFGVVYGGGIKSIRISNTTGGIEVDHLQFGFVNVAEFPSDRRHLLLFNTGVGANDLPLPAGAVDPNYRLVTSADANAPGPNAVVPSTIPDGLWLANSASSKWIAPSDNQALGAGNAGGDYAYQLSFDLTGLDHTTAVIEGAWTTDDAGLEILINGSPRSFTVPVSGYGAFHPFTINSGFVRGLNTLTFRLNNGSGPTGLRVELLGTAVEGESEPPIDLGLSAGAPVASADTLTYPVQIVNTSSTGAASVTLVNNVVNFRIVNAIPSQGSCTVTVQFIQCDLGNLGAGAVVTVQIVVQPPAAGWAAQDITVNATGPGLQQFSRSMTINWGENRAPVARAGSDRVVSGTGSQGAAVTLDGRASSDPENNTLTYRWTGPFPEGGGTVFGPTPTVTMPLGTSAVTLVVGDGQLESAPATVNITVSDFALAVNGAAAATVRAGQSATFNLALSSRHGPFANPVALSCADLPAGFACAFSSNGVVPGENGAAVTLTVTTSAQSAAASRGSLTLLAGFLGLPLVGVVLLSAAGRRRRRMLLLGALLAAAALQVACGSEVRFQSQPPNATFSIKVVGTSGGLTHTSGITVTTRP